MRAEKTPVHILERYELKYLIPGEYIAPITDFLTIYCLLDKFSRQQAHNRNFYGVNSLYFDSPGYEFLKQRIEGKAQRFNMCVRCYGGHEVGPYFLEVKQRNGVAGVVKKHRATVTQGQWPDILTDPGFRMPESEPATEKANQELFTRLALSYAVEPKILTQYQRMAFISTVDDYVRVTIDAHMLYRTQSDYNLCTRFDMTHYDNETIYANNTRSEGNVILELKCNVGEVPYWMLDLIKLFNLRQVDFSKYVSSVMVAHYDNGNWFMPFDREPNLLG